MYTYSFEVGGPGLVKAGSYKNCNIGGGNSTYHLTAILPQVAEVGGCSLVEVSLTFENAKNLVSSDYKTITINLI